MAACSSSRDKTDLNSLMHLMDEVYKDTKTNSFKCRAGFRCDFVAENVQQLLAHEQKCEWTMVVCETPGCTFKAVPKIFELHSATCPPDEDAASPAKPKSDKKSPKKKAEAEKTGETSKATDSANRAANGAIKKTSTVIKSSFMEGCGFWGISTDLLFHQPSCDLAPSFSQLENEKKSPKQEINPEETTKATTTVNGSMKKTSTVIKSSSMEECQYGCGFRGIPTDLLFHEASCDLAPSFPHLEDEKESSEQEINSEEIEETTKATTTINGATKKTSTVTTKTTSMDNSKNVSSPLQLKSDKQSPEKSTNLQEASNGTSAIKSSMDSCRYGCEFKGTPADLLAHVPACEETRIVCKTPGCLFRAIPKIFELHSAACAPSNGSSPSKPKRDNQTPKQKETVNGTVFLNGAIKKTNPSIGECRHGCKYMGTSAKGLQDHEFLCLFQPAKTFTNSTQKNTVSNLPKFKCRYGCEYRGTSHELHVHESKCKATMVYCRFEDCSYRVIPQLLQNHEDTCPNSWDTCEKGCGYEARFKDLQDHQAACRYVSGSSKYHSLQYGVNTCRYHCGYMAVSNKLWHHEEQCKLTLKRCRFADCEQRMTPKLLKKHEETCPNSWDTCVKGCGYEATFKDLQDHQYDCDYVSGSSKYYTLQYGVNTCRYHCGYMAVSNKLLHHEEQCQLTLVRCSFSGCPQRLTPKFLPNHEATCRYYRPMKKSQSAAQLSVNYGKKEQGNMASSALAAKNVLEAKQKPKEAKNSAMSVTAKIEKAKEKIKDICFDCFELVSRDQMTEHSKICSSNKTVPVNNGTLPKVQPAVKVSPIKQPDSSNNLKCCWKPCSMTGSKSDLEEHQLVCPKRIIACKWSPCAVLASILDMEKHVKVCDFRMKTCTICFAQFPVAELEKHRKNCSLDRNQSNKSLAKSTSSCCCSLYESTSASDADISLPAPISKREVHRVINNGCGLIWHLTIESVIFKCCTMFKEDGSFSYFAKYYGNSGDGRNFRIKIKLQHPTLKKITLEEENDCGNVENPGTFSIEGEQIKMFLDDEDKLSFNFSIV